MPLQIEDVNRTLRGVAWSRAKGELNAMLATYHYPYDCNVSQDERIKSAIANFIKIVEEHRLNG